MITDTRNPYPEPPDVLSVRSGVTTKTHQMLSPALAALVLAGCVVAQPVAPGPVVGGGYAYGGYGELPSNYYDHLYGYGVWQTVPGYGPVWCPSVASGWSPYVYGPGAAWNFTFYFGDWVHTPHGWGWVPGHRHHPHWRHWAHRGHRHRGHHHGRRHDDDDRHHGRRHHDDGYDHRRHGEHRERFVHPTPPRRAWSPRGTDSPRTAEPPRERPVFRSRIPEPSPRVERPDRGERRGFGDRGGRGGQGAPTGPSPGLRSPGVPIAGPPQAWRGGNSGRGVRVDAPRRAYSPRVVSPTAPMAPRTPAQQFRAHGGSGRPTMGRGQPTGGQMRGGNPRGGNARGGGSVRGGGRGSGRPEGGQWRGRW